MSRRFKKQMKTISNDEDFDENFIEEINNYKLEKSVDNSLEDTENTDNKKDRLDNLFKSQMVNVLYNFSKKCVGLLKGTIVLIFKVSGIYFLWIFLHFMASHLYVKFCVSNTLFGFFMSPFMSVTPHCQGLRWLIYTGANIISNMWIILGTWLASTIFVIHKDAPTEVR